MNLDALLSGMVLLCAIGTVANLLMFRKRGRSAYLLAGAFLALGILILLYRDGAPMATLILPGAIVLGLLMADIVVRSAQRANRP